MAAEGSEVARGQLMYYVKECPLSPKFCTGKRWNHKRWGCTQDDAILNFRDHLRNKHGVTKPELTEHICDMLEFECFIGNQQVPVPELTPPTAKRTLADQLVAEKKKRTKTEPPDELPEKLPADEPAASAPGEDTIDSDQVMLALGKIETTLAQAKNAVRAARWNMQSTDSLLPYLKASATTLSNTKANLRRNDDD